MSNSIIEKANLLRSFSLQALKYQFRDAIAELEKTEPNWFELTVLSLGLCAITGLRDALEGKIEPTLSWYYPNFNMGLSAPWDTNPEQCSLGFFSANPAKEDDQACYEPVKLSAELPPETQKELFADFRGFLVLQALTGGLALLKKPIANVEEEEALAQDPDEDDEYEYEGDYEYKPVLTPLTKQFLNQWPDEKDAIIEELSNPVTPYNVWTPKSTSTGEVLTIRGMHFKMQLDKMPIQGYVTLEFYPLLIDPLKNRSYFPITASVIFATINLPNGSRYRPDAQYWPAEVKEAFWKIIIDSVEKEISAKSQIPSSNVLSGKPKATRQRRRTGPKPTSAHQQTSQEITAMMQAFTAKHTLSDIDYLPEEPVIVYPTSFEAFTLKLNLSRLYTETERRKMGMAGLHEEFSSMMGEPDAALLYNFMIGAALREGKQRAAICQLIDLLNWNLKSKADWDAASVKLWRWIKLYDSAECHGTRQGYYNSKLIPMRTPLLHISGVYGDNPGMPEEISWNVGDWADDIKTDPSELPFFGDLMHLLKYSAKTPAGKLARGLGMAFNYWFRVNLKSHRVKVVLSQNKQFNELKFPEITRYALLTRFNITPDFNTELHGVNPMRFVHLFNEAIEMLKDGAIGSFEPIKEPSKARGRQKWQEAWLKEDIFDARPAREWSSNGIKMLNGSQNKQKRLR